MDISNIIFLLTFFFFPLLGLLISINIDKGELLKIIKLAILIFLIHNTFFFLGFSVKGDYIDYDIFSLEYLVFCLAVFILFKYKSVFAKVVGVLGSIIITIIFIIGVLLWLFLPGSYKAENIFYFENNSNAYETR